MLSLMMIECRPFRWQSNKQMNGVRLCDECARSCCVRVVIGHWPEWSYGIQFYFRCTLLCTHTHAVCDRTTSHTIQRLRHHGPIRKLYGRMWMSVNASLYYYGSCVWLRHLCPCAFTPYINALQPQQEKEIAYFFNFVFQNANTTHVVYTSNSIELFIIIMINLPSFNWLPYAFYAEKKNNENHIQHIQRE